MNRLRDIRKERGLTQEQIASYMGVSRSTVSFWESGHVKLTLEDAANLADLLDVSLDRMAGRDYMTPYEKVYEGMNQQGRESLDFQIEAHRNNPMYSKKGSQIGAAL